MKVKLQGLHILIASANELTLFMMQIVKHVKIISLSTIDRKIFPIEKSLFFDIIKQIQGWTRTTNFINKKENKLEQSCRHAWPSLENIY